MLSSKFLKDIMTEAYPIIQRQLADAQVIASFRELVTANGGDWSALKALMKAHVEDSLDDSGEGKRVRKILDKADSSNAYAEMLGLANMNEKNYIAGDDETEEPAPDRIAELLSDASLGLVRASEIKKSEPQPTKAAGSDLTTSQPLNGQVADNPVAKAADDANSGHAMSEVSAVADAPEQAEVASRVAGDRAPAATSEVMDATAGETAPLYPEPGVVYWESSPPEGVERHEYSAAFGTMGQDIAVIEDDLARSKAEPIVKMGNVILDGWARYMAARGMVGLDGKPVEYSVVQYDGRDELLDCIRWNLAGRILTEDQKRIICAKLVKLYPQRKGPIWGAFEFGMELV